MITAERLREVLCYDPTTGVFTWRKAISSHAIVGETAGGPKPPKGYVCISIDKRRYYAHRLAWLWMTGEWPAADVDHEKLKHGDNRWKNLRAASRSENRCNIGPHRDNRSGFKGVYFNKRRHTWNARIRKHGRDHHLGVFASPEAAHAAYADAARRLHGEFSRLT